MTVRILFPCLLTACFVLSCALTVAGQANNPDGRPRSVVTNATSLKPIDIESTTVPDTTVNVRAPITATSNNPLFGLFHTALTAAMAERLGAYYHYGSTGPNAFDCSGFVWSSFQAAGVKFERGPARSYWARFAPVTKADEFKFGTLVFFGGLKHVGIVVDEHGFYHSSRHSGVIYSPFNDYWLARIDGFRRVSLDSIQAPVAVEKVRAPKPATDAEIVEATNAP